MLERYQTACAFAPACRRLSSLQNRCPRAGRYVSPEGLVPCAKKSSGPPGRLLAPVLPDCLRMTVDLPEHDSSITTPAYARALYRLDSDGLCNQAITLICR